MTGGKALAEPLPGQFRGGLNVDMPLVTFHLTGAFRPETIHHSLFTIHHKVRGGIMAHSYEELSKMTVLQLREIAKGLGHEAVKAYSTMHKEKLLPALCIALGIEAHEHHHVVGINKTAIKQQIREMKARRDEILARKSKDELKPVLRKIHDLKRELRKHTV